MTLTAEIIQRFGPEAEAREFYESLILAFTAKLGARHLGALSPYPKVEVGLGVKGMKSWRAVAHLFFGGFEEDAEIVLRSLVDVVVDMKFISLDPKERAQRFIDYQKIHGLRWLREGKKRLDVTRDEELPGIEAELNRDAADVLKRRPEWKRLLPRPRVSLDTR